MVVNFRYPFAETDYVKVVDETCTHAHLTFSPYMGIWEFDAIEKMKELLELKNYYLKDSDANEKKRGVFIDIGAQVGLYTLCAKWLPNLDFYAFEPFPKSCSLLRANVELNNLSNVKVFDFALSDKISSSSTLQTCLNHNGLHTMAENPVRFGDIESIPVQTTTLDAFFEPWLSESFAGAPIAYVKIDTEGWEYFILCGGMKLLKRWKPILQLEISDLNMSQSGVTYEMISELLYKQLGYKKIAQVGSEECFFV